MEENESFNKDFLKYAEEALLMAKTCLVTFRIENEGITSTKAKIINISMQPNEESYLETDNGLFIRLDKLLSIDGLPSGNLA